MKKILRLVSLILVVTMLPIHSFAEVIYGDVGVALPIQDSMEDVTKFKVNNNESIADGDMSVSLTQDCKDGEYAHEVKVKDIENKDNGEFVLTQSEEVFDINNYGKLKLWVKPSIGAKWIEFYLRDDENNDDFVTNDENNDGKFEVGKDITSGMWNEITLDLTTIDGLPDTDGETLAKMLVVRVNDKSTWRFDGAKVVPSKVYDVDLSNMVAPNVVVNEDGGVQFKSHGDSYDVTPTILTNNDNLVYGISDDSAKEFNKGTFSNSGVVINSVGNLEFKSVNFNLCTGGTIISNGESSSEKYAFDNSENTNNWWSSYWSGNSMVGYSYIGYNFSYAKNIKGFKLKQYNGANSNIDRVNVQYSNDGVTWNNAQTVSIIKDGVFRIYNVNTDKFAKNWRLLADSYCGSSWRIHELEMYDAIEKGVYTSRIIDNLSILENCIPKFELNGVNINNLKIEARILYNDDSWMEWQTLENNCEISNIENYNLDKAKLQYRLSLASEMKSDIPIVHSVAIRGSKFKEEVSRQKILKSKLLKISNKLNHKDNNKIKSEFNSITTYFSAFELKPTNFKLSAEGTKLYFSNINDDNSIYYINLTSGKTLKIHNITNCVIIDVSKDGRKMIFTSNNNLYIYNDISGTVENISNNPKYYKMRSNGEVVLVDSTGVVYSHKDNTKIQIYNLEKSDIRGFDVAKDGTNIFYTKYNSSSTTSPYSVQVIEKIADRWVQRELISSSDIYNIKSNFTGDLVIYNGRYCYDMNLKITRKLSNNISKMISDNKAIYSSSGLYHIYDIDRDIATKIKTDSYFSNYDIDDAGEKIIYHTDAGLVIQYINPVTDPTRYLLSFDNKASWYTYQDGKWILASTEREPTKATFDQYGLTKDEINGLTQSDFEKLYENGREIYTVDFAIYFASPDMYTTPVINSIKIYTSEADETGKATEDLYTVKKIDYDGTSWRKINKIYPVEITSKQAKIYYFFKVEDKYCYYDGTEWKTEEDTEISDLLADTKANWIEITKIGMTADKLRTIPADKLTSKLANKEFSIEYIIKVNDESTKDYNSNIRIDYAETLIPNSDLTLKVLFLDGTQKEYIGMNNRDVEDFVDWVNKKQYGSGPAFKIIKTPTTYELVNFYTVKQVLVEKE